MGKGILLSACDDLSDSFHNPSVFSPYLVISTDSGHASRVLIEEPTKLRIVEPHTANARESATHIYCSRRLRAASCTHSSCSGRIISTTSHLTMNKNLDSGLTPAKDVLFNNHARNRMSHGLVMTHPIPLKASISWSAFHRIPNVARYCWIRKGYPLPTTNT